MGRSNITLGATNRLQEIAAMTDSERAAFLDHDGWNDNPFAQHATMAEYVIPSDGTIADIAGHV